MKRYSPPKVHMVSFVVEKGMEISTEDFEPETWDEDTPGSHSTTFGAQEWREEGGGSSTTAFETYNW